VSSFPPDWKIKPKLAEALWEVGGSMVYPRLCKALAPGAEDADGHDMRPALVFIFWFEVMDGRRRCWLDIPGGVRGLGETGLVTAKREAREETAGFIDIGANPRFQHLSELSDQTDEQSIR
jgi:hypothetical protein